MKKKRRGRSPLRTITLILTVSIFLIMLTVMTLQGLLIYLHLRILNNANVRLPQFWRPIPLLIVLSAIVGVALTLLVSRIPLKPVRVLIDAINQLASGNFSVRIHLDLTPEFVRLSESFNRMAQELENTELLRSDFINNFSHEFKTPIVSLRGFAKILKSGDLTPQERDEYLDIIINESNRLSLLASNVLNLSKIEKISIVTDTSTFDLTEEIRRCILLLESKWQKKELELIIDMEEISYHGNKDLLNQLFINLIDNAIKFSPEKGKLKVKLNRSEQEDVVFKILDNGCGMEEETIKHIFDRFYQGDASHATEGNGIGLTIAQRIVSLHNGTLTVESEAGIGSTFTVMLPKPEQPDI